MFLNKLEYLSQSGEINTKTYGHYVCDKCHVEYKRQYFLAQRLYQNPLYNCDMCRHCWFKLRFGGENNPAYGKVYRTKETHPEWAFQISKTAIEREINVGDKNGMKQPEARAKASKTRREKVTSSPEYRLACSKSRKLAWANGEYDHVPVGKCKWYDHLKSDGTTIKLQGTWEVAYARYLDSQNIKYIAHRGTISYVDENNTTHTYYPDFYLIDNNEYIDIKGAFWEDKQKEKFTHIRNSNPNITIKILMKEDLKALGIDVVEIQNELLSH